MKEELMRFFEEYKKVCSAYQLAGSTLYYDLVTVAPKNGREYRQEMMSLLSGEAFTYQMNLESLKKLEQLYELLEDGDLKRELSLYLKSVEMERKLPKDVYIRYRQTLSKSEEAWRKAKEENNYSLFKEELKQTILVIKEVLGYLDKDCSDYDYLLNHYQEGMNKAKYDELFDLIKQELLPLIQQIAHKQIIDNSLLYQNYDIHQQELFVKELQDYMQVNRDECYMTTTEHPFTEFFSAHEARITTHYYEKNVMSAIFSTIHEYGHALYSLQVNEDYDGTALKNEIGMGMHESQSRFMENHIGRHPSFWKVNYPKLQKHFPHQLSQVSLEDFLKMMNCSYPSLIRIEADELTYPIHILIRYELEKEIFDGHMDLDQLEDMWNDKYEEYLGIRPSHAGVGILQDIHWAAGNFGYFPTYALGSAYAAQFYHAMKKDIDVDKILKSGDFKEISQWLKDHIHHDGASLTADEILLKATGHLFDAREYIDELVKKYRYLYQL